MKHYNGSHKYLNCCCVRYIIIRAIYTTYTLNNQIENLIAITKYQCIFYKVLVAYKPYTNSSLLEF